MVIIIYFDGVNTITIDHYRFEHFEKKVQVYDFLVVELFNMSIKADAALLPRWFTREIEEDHCKFHVYHNKQIN